MKIQAIDKSKLAKTDEEYLALISSDADWIARSSDDLQTLRDTKEGPLAKLSEESYYEFVNSLMFSQGGLATANCRPVMNELTLKEVGDLFGRFGIDLGLAADHEGFKCVSLHNCKVMTDYICMSNC